MNKIRDFKDLKTWQDGHKLVIRIYKITNKFPSREDFILVSQMRKSATSFTSNIAEGFGRKTYKDKIHFYYMAQGSLIELKNQLLISKDVGYITPHVYNKLLYQADTCHKLLQSLITKSKTFLNPKS